MALIEKGICRIDHINENGLGVSSTKLGKIELPYTLVGETVEFERHSYRSQKNTILKEILTQSTDRIKPVCPYFGACGGCLLQHMNANLYQQFKLKLITDALLKHNLETRIKDIVTPQSGRRRVNMKALKKNDKIFLGFARFRSDQIINIDQCNVLSPKLSDLIPIVKKALDKILSRSQKASIYMTEAANGVDILIESNEKLEPTIQKDDFPEYVIRLQLNQESIFTQEIPHVLFNNSAVKIDNKSFLQATSDSDKILGKIVTEYVPKSGKALDLFCGRGTLTIPLVESTNLTVDSFESDENAIAALKETCKKVNTHLRDLYEKPLTSLELSEYDVAVMNPPRMGAKKQSSEIAKSNIKTLIYVSCNPLTFARDASILCNNEYNLLEIVPFDQFLYSPHIELVALFKKTDSMSKARKL